MPRSPLNNDGIHYCKCGEVAYYPCARARCPSCNAAPPPLQGHQSVSDARLAALASAAPHLRSLQSLSLTDSALTASSLKPLARLLNQVAGSLTRLCLARSCSMDVFGAGAFQQARLLLSISATLKALEELDLGGCNWVDVPAAVFTPLAGAGLQKLVKINLVGSRIKGLIAASIATKVQIR